MASVDEQNAKTISPAAALMQTRQPGADYITSKSSIFTPEYLIRYQSGKGLFGKKPDKFFACFQLSACANQGFHVVEVTLQCATPVDVRLYSSWRTSSKLFEHDIAGILELARHAQVPSLVSRCA